MSSTKMISPLLITPDSVRHLLRFLDVVRRQDDGHAALSEPPNHLPHVAAQLDVNPGGRLIEEQDHRLVRQGLGNHDPSLHPPRQVHDLRVLLVPKRKLTQQLLDVRRARGLAEKPSAEVHRRPHTLERVGRNLLRHKPDLRPSRAIPGHHIMPVDQHRTGARVDDPANDTDERRLPRAVRPQERKDLPTPNLQIHVLEGHEPRLVGLTKLGDGDNRLHGQH